MVPHRLNYGAGLHSCQYNMFAQQWQIQGHPSVCVLVVVFVVTTDMYDC